ncbi:MAG: RimK/LysX family protein, partial [Burkholderiaceae bacterium]
AVLHDVRQVRNSGGIHSMRMVIRTQLRIGNDIVLNPEVTLIERRIMRYPMLIGRTALRKACALVDSHQSWLHGGGG